ncbi:MAG: hypothetical protein GYB65_02750 [Chloroflexi bacterium]|nr:hypothetical protein [Chloroflexota bacterium]
MVPRPRAGVVFLLFACLYVLSLGRGLYTSDGVVMFETTRALAEDGTLALDPNPELPQIVPGQGGVYYGKYDPGLPLLGIPFYVTGDWLGRVNYAHRYRLATTAYLLVPALSAAGAVTALYALARQLYGDRRALLVALAAGFGALLWSYARALFPEATLALALTGAVGLIVTAGRVAGRGSERMPGVRFLPLPLTPSPHAERGKSGGGVVPSPFDRGRTYDSRDYRGGVNQNETPEGAFHMQFVAERVLLAGIVFGAGMLVRAALAIYALPLAVLIVRTSPRGWRARVGRLVTFGAGMTPFVAGLLWHNDLRFGSLFEFGYAGERFSTLPWEGVLGLLASPGKSVFLYAPPLVLSVVLWPRFRRAYPALGLFLALAWITALGFYGAWWAWHGGWCWGPRLLVPLLPLSCLPLGMLPDRRAWRFAAGVLVALGIGVNALGVLTDVNQHYGAVFNTDSVNSDDDAYRTLHTDPAQSPLVGAAQMVARGETEPLVLFHLKDTGLPPTWSIGAPLLLLIGLAWGGFVIVRALAHPHASRNCPLPPT